MSSGANTNLFHKKAWVGFLISIFINNCLYAHTNSIGYTNSGAGAVTFWYGSWHSNVGFNEGSINIVGPNNFNVTNPFTLLTTTKLQGLVDEINNVYSDGTQLVGDNTGSTTVTWQGAQVSGLLPDQYTFLPISRLKTQQ